MYDKFERRIESPKGDAIMMGMQQQHGANHKGGKGKNTEKNAQKQQTAGGAQQHQQGDHPRSQPHQQHHQGGSADLGNEPKKHSTTTRPREQSKL